MTHTIKRLFVSALALFLIACNATAVKPTDPSPVLAAIDQRGELILGTSADMPPMSSVRDDGKVVGLDVDIARFMAEALDVKLNIRTMPFAELIPAMQRGEIDVIISNMTITQRRNRQVAFIGPYMTSGKCMITRQQALARAEASADLNTPDTRVAVMKGTTSEDFVTTLLPQATVIANQDRQASIEMVKNDQVDAFLTDFPICLSTLKDNPDAGFVSLLSPLSYEPIGIAVPASDPLFVNWTEHFLQRMEALGVLDEIGKRWFGEYGDAISIK